MPNPTFAERTRRAQLAALRAGATAMLETFGLPGSTLTLVDFEFNATYRIDTPDGERYAMRLNVNSSSELANVQAEAEWVDAISRDTTVLVPRVRPTIDGHLCASVEISGLDGAIPVVIYSWLDGPDLGERVGVNRMWFVGEAMARLHDHGEQWTPPASLRRIDSTYLDTSNNLEQFEAPWFDDASRAVLDEAYSRADAIAKPLFDRSPRFAIHGDLHMWNLKWVDGQIAVFDFDDGGLGLAAQDLAISTYYLRDNANKEQALFDGYRSLRPLPDMTAAEFEALVAARNLLLFNEVITWSTAFADDFLPGFLAKTTRRMRNYLDTGRFVYEVEG